MPAKRKSKSLHALHSTRDQSTTRTAPRLSTVATVKAPSYLSKPAKDEFNRVAKELADAGLLTNVSLNILASYAASFANWKLAEQDLQERGATIFVESSTRTGKTVRPLINPSVRSYAVFKKLMLDSAKAFGIDPASHGRINLPETGAERQLDPFEKFVAGIPYNAHDLELLGITQSEDEDIITYTDPTLKETTMKTTFNASKPAAFQRGPIPALFKDAEIAITLTNCRSRGTWTLSLAVLNQRTMKLAGRVNTTMSTYGLLSVGLLSALRTVSKYAQESAKAAHGRTTAHKTRVKVSVTDADFGPATAGLKTLRTGGNIADELQRVSKRFELTFESIEAGSRDVQQLATFASRALMPYAVDVFTPSVAASFA